MYVLSAHNYLSTCHVVRSSSYMTRASVKLSALLCIWLWCLFVRYRCMGRGALFFAVVVSSHRRSVGRCRTCDASGDCCRRSSSSNSQTRPVLGGWTIRGPAMRRRRALQRARRLQSSGWNRRSLVWARARGLTPQIITRPLSGRF